MDHGKQYYKDQYYYFVQISCYSELYLSITDFGKLQLFLHLCSLLNHT